MRAPDFVYGIVPRLGEYGFEVKPTSADHRLVARVRSLASSFAWSGSVGPQAIAIAYDPELPILVARYGLDPRDPSGRVSLLLHVWVSANESEANLLVDELWKQSGNSASQDAFVKGAGRRITGPDRAFYATNFDRVWGGQVKRNSSAEDSPQPDRTTARPRSDKSLGTPSSGGKVSAGLALLCLGLAGLAFYAYDQQKKTKVTLESRLFDTLLDHDKEKKRLVSEIEMLRKTEKALNEAVKSKGEEIEKKEKEIKGHIATKEVLQKQLADFVKPLDARDEKRVQAENIELRASQANVKALLLKSKSELESVGAAIGEAQAALEDVLKLVPEQPKPAGESQEQNKESPSDIRTGKGSEPLPHER